MPVNTVHIMWEDSLRVCSVGARGHCLSVYIVLEDTVRVRTGSQTSSVTSSNWSCFRQALPFLSLRSPPLGLLLLPLPFSHVLTLSLLVDSFAFVFENYHCFCPSVSLSLALSYSVPLSLTNSLPHCPRFFLTFWFDTEKALFQVIFGLLLMFAD